MVVRDSTNPLQSFFAPGVDLLMTPEDREFHRVVALYYARRWLFIRAAKLRRLDKADKDAKEVSPGSPTAFPRAMLRDGFMCHISWTWTLDGLD
jgi:hypothetical protein